MSEEPGDLEGFEVTPYFERSVMGDPTRRERVLPHVAQVVNEAEEKQTQSDGKVRHWRYVADLGHHIRVITTQDGALLGAHEDSQYTRRSRRRSD